MLSPYQSRMKKLREAFGNNAETLVPTLIRVQFWFDTNFGMSPIFENDKSTIFVTICSFFENLATLS